ncbi:MAG: polysaccharide biosynthesis tyrosine autokinase [Terriglobia bacterium]
MNDKTLALRSPEPGSPGAVERIAFYQAAPSPEPESADNTTPFSHYLWMISRHKWRLLLFVGIAVAATIIVSSRLTPYYESTATLDVDRMAPQSVIGQDSAGARASVSDTDAFLTTQLQLIKSDSVLRPVAQKLKIIPPAVAAKDPSHGEAPVSLNYLSVARPAKTNLLLISYRSPDPVFAAAVANEVANSYINHSYEIRFQATEKQSTFMASQLDGLKARMERSQMALSQFEKELNVISPEEKTNILSARLQQLNTAWTTSQGDRVAKEAAAKSVHSGTVEALEASQQGEQLRKLSDRIAEASEKFATLKTQFLPNHPEYKKAQSQESELKQQFESLKQNIQKRIDSEYAEALDREKQLGAAVAQVKGEFDSLNSKSVEYHALKRDADADKTVYDELTKKINEAGINAGFQGSSIRMADRARPARTPIYPRTRFNALLAFVASTFLGIVVIFVSESMDHTLRDPDQIQRQLQTEVLGALPVVKAWRGHLPGAKSGDEAGHRPFFGTGTGNTYEEAVRTLRDSILLPNAESRPRTLLLTSATPREGKTTTAVHLAVVHSQQKRRTLIIDGDLRRPGVYQHVGLNNDKGLSNVVNGEAEWRDLLQNPEGLPYLSVLVAGPPSRKAADGLGETLRQLLAEAVNEYDLIICDAPPLLGFAESLQIAALVDGVVVVALAGQTERTAVASVLSNLKRLKANVIGLALNEVRSDMSERYYYYGYYGKYYSRYYKPLSS